MSTIGAQLTYAWSLVAKREAEIEHLEKVCDELRRQRDQARSIAASLEAGADPYEAP